MLVMVIDSAALSVPGTEVLPASYQRSSSFWFPLKTLQTPISAGIPVSHFCHQIPHPGRLIRIPMPAPFFFFPQGVSVSVGSQRLSEPEETSLSGT